MVYLNKWATTIPEEGKKTIFIIPVGHHSYICILNICKIEALEKIRPEQDLKPWHLQKVPHWEIFLLFGLD